jgi:uncharacterized protein
VSASEAFFLMAAAFAAGVMNAVAGGGTLVTFPVLILFGTPPVIANATSTLALVVGTSGGIYGYRRHLAEVAEWLPLFVPVSLIGGFLGSFLLTHGSPELFSKLVPYLILFATFLFMIQGAVRRFALRPSETCPTGAGMFPVLTFQFLVSLYGGYFGAGIGILMLAALGFMGFSDIHRMNTLKNVLGSLINLVAALWFTLCGLIDWPRMAVMTVGAVAGYYAGARFALWLPQRTVRILISATGLVITAVMFWKLRR